MPWRVTRGLTKKLKIVLPEEEVSKELDAGFKKIKNEASIKGFRRGKVPRHILEKTYGQQVRAEVAEKLFLHVGFVAHLENDAFDLLPGATFIKGYIKSYCRVLGIKPEPLIALFNELEIDVDEPSSTTGQVNTPVKPINGFKVKRSVDDIPPFKERRTARRRFSWWPHVMGVLVMALVTFWVASLQEVEIPNMTLYRLLPDFLKMDPTKSASPAEGMSASGSSVDIGKDIEKSLAEGENSNVTGEVDPPFAVLDAEARRVRGAATAPAVSPTLPGELAWRQGWDREPLTDFSVTALSKSHEKKNGLVSFRIEVTEAGSQAAAKRGHRLQLTFLDRAQIAVLDGAGKEAHNESHARGSEVRVALLGPPPYQLGVSDASAVAIRFDDQPLVLP
ncbi:MAG: trigger factor [Gammaproteobacteria bacterium]